MLKLLKGLSFQGLLWSEVLLDSDWLLFVIVDVLKYNNQSGNNLSFGKSNPSEDGCFKSYSKTIIGGVFSARAYAHLQKFELDHFEICFRPFFSQVIWLILVIF